ncbi:MAG: tRNA (adenosine(37)-N6)-dimethylallyltransferase MiaA [Culicoidibacterales bacterium]
MLKQKVVIISGPTASGKSKFAIDLAQKIGGEIISADSMQVFKGLDIGSAKVTIAEQLGIKHHLIDEIAPDKLYSIAQFQIEARSAIAKISASGRVPIVVGGSGLYIQSLVFDYEFSKQEKLDLIRYEKISDEELFKRLQVVDSEASLKILPQNRRRVIYAIALAEQTEANKSSRERKQKHELLYDIFPIALMPKRDQLYHNINMRVLDMIAKGLVAEVEYFNGHFTLCDQVKSAIGYREPLAFIKGEIATSKLLVEAIQQNTRKFAKRQVTWIRNQQIKYYQITTNELTKEEKQDLLFFLEQK